MRRQAGRKRPFLNCPGETCSLVWQSFEAYVRTYGLMAVGSDQTLIREYVSNLFRLNNVP